MKKTEIHIEDTCGASLSPNIIKTGEDALVFIDALRTSNTIIALIRSGVAKVIPVSGVDEARKMREEKKEDDVIFAGERGGEKLDFCDYGNSPVEIIADREKIKGKTAVVTTTNFTEVFERYKECDCFKMVGSLLNLEGVKDIVSSGRFRNVFLIPAGRKGKPAPEDEETALYMKDYLDGKIGSEKATDSLADAYHGSESGSNLRNLGYGGDVELCLRMNRMDVVPVFKGGYFTRRDDHGR
jgi:2-phosphosulfolactate phosphatase